MRIVEALRTRNVRADTIYEPERIWSSAGGA